MTIALNSTAAPTGTGTPILILDNVGDKYRGAVVDIVAKQETEYLSQGDRDRGQIARPVWWDNKRPTAYAEDIARSRGLDPVMFDVITFLTIKAAGATKSGEEATPIEEGDIVAMFAHGPRGRGWRDALRDRGGVNVGDQVLISFDSEDPDTRAKTITFTFEASDPAVVKAATDAYHELHAVSLPSSAAPAPTAATPAPANVEPF